VTGVISRFGVLGVFLVMVPESAGIPIPSEATLLFSGFAVHQGWMSFPLAVLAATAGNLVGSLLAYALGASRLLERIPLVGATVRRWEGLFERHGTRAVLIARLLPLARTFISLPAGAKHVRLLPFVALTTIGCALWATALVLTGMVAGSAWASFSSTLGRVLLIAGLATIATSLTRGRRPS
jgi:membrane protein DedA with SNARE-associated domain